MIERGPSSEIGEELRTDQLKPETVYILQAVVELVRRVLKHGENGRYVIIGPGLSLREGYYWVAR